jgi:hypothetical protein
MMIIGLSVGVVVIGLVGGVLLFEFGRTRPHAVPPYLGQLLSDGSFAGESDTCFTEVDCPERMFCYRAVDREYIYGKQDWTIDEYKDVPMEIESVCGCYAML